MHIAVTTLPGYNPQEKKLLARRLKEEAANLTGVTAYTVSVSVKDLPIEKWDDFIRELPDDEIIIPETYWEYIKRALRRIIFSMPPRKLFRKKLCDFNKAL